MGDRFSGGLDAAIADAARAFSRNIMSFLDGAGELLGKSVSPAKEAEPEIDSPSAGLGPADPGAEVSFTPSQGLQTQLGDLNLTRLGSVDISGHDLGHLVAVTGMYMPERGAAREMA